MLFYVGSEGAEDLIKGLGPVDMNTISVLWVRLRIPIVGKGATGFSL